MAGLPGMSIPVGFDSKKLPVGLQILGKWFDEQSIFNIANTYQNNTDWHLKAPQVY
jgi:aspartyl-tRNA(Asn)/glutamyl-tRNA(Gln) amidotransferase subunit A